MNFSTALYEYGKNGANRAPDLSAYLEAIVLLNAPEGRLALFDLARSLLTAIPPNAARGFGGAPVEYVAQELERSANACRRDGMEARCRMLAQRLPTTAEHLQCLDVALSVCRLRGGIGPRQTGALLRMQAIFELSDSQIDRLIERHL